MKYAVALLNCFDNENHVVIVEADDPITAMIHGAVEILNVADPDTDEWLQDMLKDIPDADGYAARIEEIQGGFFNGDMAISEPVPID